jgi:hypothetical protein
VCGAQADAATTWSSGSDAERLRQAGVHLATPVIGFMESLSRVEVVESLLDTSGVGVEPECSSDPKAQPIQRPMIDPKPQGK